MYILFKISEFSVHKEELATSPIFRVKIQFASKLTKSTSVSLIVKVPSVRSNQGDDIVFDSEIKVYTAALEEMHRLLNASDKKVQLGPRL